MTMDHSLELLYQQCQKNEDLCKKLEDMTSKLPCNNHAWFYLNADALVLRDANVNEPLSDKTYQPFITLVPSDGDKSSSIMEDIENSQQSTSSAVTEDQFKWVLNDPELPLNIREYILRQNENRSNEEVLNESDTLSFCQYFINSDKPFSEIAGTMLFKLVLYPKISSPNNTFLSQLFLQKLQELTNKFPSFTINGVIIPLVKNENLGKHQQDVICAILNEIKSEYMEETSTKLLMAIPPDKDISIKLLKVIMDRKPRFGPELALLLVMKLVELSTSFSTNFQFGNLLIEIIPTLNEKLCETSLQNLKVIIEKHKTFMKTPALNLISKLKTK